MNKLQKSRELLKKYLQNTPKELLQQKFDKYNNMSCEGVTLYEYVSMFEKNYDFIHKTISQHKTMLVTEWQSKIHQNIDEFTVKIGTTPKQLKSTSTTNAFDNKNITQFKLAS